MKSEVADRKAAVGLVKIKGSAIFFSKGLIKRA
jgi:hypothetical protein